VRWPQERTYLQQFFFLLCAGLVQTSKRRACPQETKRERSLFINRQKLEFRRGRELHEPSLQPQMVSSSRYETRSTCLPKLSSCCLLMDRPTSRGRPLSRTKQIMPHPPSCSPAVPVPSPRSAATRLPVSADAPAARFLEGNLLIRVKKQLRREQHGHRHPVKKWSTALAAVAAAAPARKRAAGASPRRACCRCG